MHSFIPLRFAGVSYTNKFELRREECAGKAMVCQGVLTEWLKEWMMSKSDH